MKKRRLTLSILLCTILGFWGAKAQIDPAATCETQALYQQLKMMSGNQLLFGHQNSTLEGIGWVDYAGTTQQSDVVTAVSDYPAVVGFDFVRGYGLFYNHVIKTYERGGIVTISDHMDNPVTGGNTWDVSDTTVVSEIITEGSNANQIFKYYLQQSANFFKNAKSNGTPVPIIYRPFHENTGSWFWWGKNLCSKDDYIDMWRYTVHYLRDTLDVHNLLFAYSPSDMKGYGDYDLRYPGDDYVDIIGFDMYANGDFSTSLVENCREAVNFANARGKVAALTEFGVRDGIQNTNINTWFTSAFLNPIKNDPVARQIVFALTWRNGDLTHHWIPLSGDPTFVSFVNMYNDPYSGFESNLPSDLYNCSIVSTQEENPNTAHHIYMYPNPATDWLQIELDHIGNEGANIQVFNLWGQSVMQQSTQSAATTIGVAHLPAGTYIINIIDNQTKIISHSKFVKR